MKWGEKGRIISTYLENYNTNSQIFVEWNIETVHIYLNWEWDLKNNIMLIFGGANADLYKMDFWKSKKMSENI